MNQSGKIEHGAAHSFQRYTALLHAQDPKAVAVKEKFEKALKAAEQEMSNRNKDVNSRARHSPAGLPYFLMYPSTDTEPVTPKNWGMTGRGIP